ncbi:MAG: hypothetical protein GXP47_06405 [Acidobacteria bacterium]|nr:hypothetical protein [Acidobacteriota bacterium]
MGSGCSRGATLRRRERGRAELDAKALVVRVASAVAGDAGEPGGQSTGSELSWARELLAALGVERYGIRAEDLGRVLHKHPVTVPGWVLRGVRRRAKAALTPTRLEAPDMELGKRQKQEH